MRPSTNKREPIVLGVVLVFLALLAALRLARTHESSSQVAAGPASETRTPAPETPIAPKAPSAQTTILVLRVTASRVELLASSVKPFATVPASVGELAYRVEDAESGEVVARGSFPAPPLCTCSSPDAPHAAIGCVALRHDAVVRLKVPHVRPRERVRITGARGEPLATLDMEARS